MNELDPKERMWMEAENAQMDALRKHTGGCDRVVIVIVLLLFFGGILWQLFIHR